MPITLSHLGPVLKAVYARQQPQGSPGSPLVILGPPNWHARRHIPLQLKLKNEETETLLFLLIICEWKFSERNGSPAPPPLYYCTLPANTQIAIVLKLTLSYGFRVFFCSQRLVSTVPDI